MRLIDQICMYLSSKALNEWIDLDKIMEIFSKYNLSDKDVSLIIDFLKKYFLVLDKSKRAKLNKAFFNFYLESNYLESYLAYHSF